MKSSWSHETPLSKAAAGLAILALISLALWGSTLFLIPGDGDTYPGGALGTGALIGLAGAAVAVAGLLVICAIAFVRVAMRSFQQRGEQ
jgi:uncharacterized membrane protein